MAVLSKEQETSFATWEKTSKEGLTKSNCERRAIGLIHRLGLSGEPVKLPYGAFH